MAQAESSYRPPLKRWKQVFQKNGHRCVYCGEDLLEHLRTYHSSSEDHLYPKSPRRPGVPKGADDDRNLVSACYTCNTLKSDFIPEICLESKSVADEFFSETEEGLRFVKTEKYEDYLKLVRDHIEKKKNDRTEEMNKERTRVGWNAPSKSL